jgi:O-antigen ligase
LLDVVNLQTSSASGRLTLYRYALTEWQHRPIFGNGTGSFNIGAAPGTGHAWLPSLFLMTLHDAGLVGFAALAWLIVAFYRYTWKGLSGDRYLSLLVMGSIASFTSLLLAFQTTTGFWFAYPWIVAGIGVVAARLQPDGA